MTDRSTDTIALFQSERQRQIVSLTMQAGRVEVSHLADMFHVTTETIRRDLSDLQRQKVVRRVHGGGIPWETSVFEPRVEIRADRNDDQKRRMAMSAIDELPDHGSIIIDSGSTLTRFAEAIPEGPALSVVTNSLPVAQALAQRESLDVIVTGGRLMKDTMALVDQQAIASVEPLTVDTLFISTDAATAATGLTTPYRHEAALKQAMIRSARRVVALVDHSKFGKDEFIRFAEWTDIDVLITTTELSDSVRADIEATGATVVLA